MLQLGLNGQELLVHDLHHSLDLLRRDRSCPALLAKEIHDVRRELVAGLLVLFKLLNCKIRNFLQFGSLAKDSAIPSLLKGLS